MIISPEPSLVHRLQIILAGALGFNSLRAVAETSLLDKKYVDGLRIAAAYAEASAGRSLEERYALWNTGCVVTLPYGSILLVNHSSYAS